MKVHVLWYDYYEDSCIVGIYTAEGKQKKIEELQQEALQYCEIWGIEYKKALTKKKEEEVAPAEPTTKVCPFCKSEIAIDATRCAHCTSELNK